MIATGLKKKKKDKNKTKTKQNKTCEIGWRATLLSKQRII